MSKPVTYCGDDTPGHASRRCKECRRIVQANYRATAKEGGACSSCHIRLAVPHPPQHFYNVVQLPFSAVEWLENAALVFDEEAGEDRFTASEFIAWVRPDILRKGAA
jgi:hypothetical protein